MSVATISYSSLRDAFSEANAVSKKLDRYADNLHSSVLRKLESYSGSYTGNIQSAKNNVRTKIDLLRSKSRAYSNYANDLGELKEECLNTDKSVRTLVSNLTATFKQSQGIRNSVVQNTINYYLTSLGNSSAAGRWLGGAKDRAGSIKEYIKQAVEDWWDYEGGKQLIKGIVIAGLSIVIAICEMGSILGVIAGVIAIVSGVVNIVNEFRAYHETHNNEDPALGRRRSAEDSLQDTLRKETDSKLWHNVATGIDTVKFVCDTGDFLKDAGKLAKNGYKWATGYAKDITETGKAVKGLPSLKTSGKSFGSDFFNSLKGFKDGYFNFTGTETVKNWASAAKSVISADFSTRKKGIESMFGDEGILNKAIFPYINLKNADLSLGDIYKVFSGGFELKKSFVELKDHFLDSGNFIEKGVLEKLNTTCDFSISVPELNIPNCACFSRGY